MLRDPFFRCDSDYHRDKFARCERLARCNNASHMVWPRHGNPSTKWLEFYITKSQFLVITPCSSHLLSTCAFHFYPKQDTFWLLQWSSCISHSIPHFSSSFAHLDCWAISNWCRWFWGKTCEPTFIFKHQQMIGGKHRRGVIANFGKQNLQESLMSKSRSYEGVLWEEVTDISGVRCASHSEPKACKKGLCKLATMHLHLMRITNLSTFSFGTWMI